MRFCKQIVLCCLIGGLLISLSYIVLQSSPERAIAQQVQTSQQAKWQHAQLLIVTGSRNNYATLSTPTQEIREVNLVDVFKEASGRDNLDPDKKFRIVDMLNYLGYEGWQLATHAAIQIENERVARVYTFRKPRR